MRGEPLPRKVEHSQRSGDSDIEEDSESKKNPQKQHMTVRGDTARQPGGGTARVCEHFVCVKSVMETGHQNITKPWK